MKQTNHALIRDSEVRAVLGDFCMTARAGGALAAERAATVHLVASAAYLEERVGAEKTIRILQAAIASIGLQSHDKH